jgi:two-component system response regulator AdeR
MTTATSSATAVKRILVCDDDPDIVMLIETILKDAGYDVDTANGHREFSQKFDPTAPPNLILMDVRMPERDGFSIAENLGGRVPIIFVTAHDRPVYRLYAPIAGGTDYVTKPFDPEDLLRRIEQALRVDPKKSNWFLQVSAYTSGEKPSVK